MALHHPIAAFTARPAAARNPAPSARAASLRRGRTGGSGGGPGAPHWLPVAPQWRQRRGVLRAPLSASAVARGLPPEQKTPHHPPLRRTMGGAGFPAGPRVIVSWTVVP